MTDAQFEQFVSMLANVRTEVRELVTEVAQLRANSNGNAVVLNASVTVLQQDVASLGAGIAGLNKEVASISQRLFGTTELAKSLYDMVAEQTSAPVRDADEHQHRPTIYAPPDPDSAAG